MNMEITFKGKKKVIASFNGYQVATDQPVQGGGEGTAPSPFELFLASIGTCAGIYVKGFCDSRNLPSENIKIIQSLEVDRTTGMLTKIKLDIQVPADFPEKYRSALINAAELCKVKKTIAHPPAFEIVTSEK
jgi:ribosomal protein S12 methylthiotransferase accessory factor